MQSYCPLLTTTRTQKGYSSTPYREHACATMNTPRLVPPARVLYTVDFFGAAVLSVVNATSNGIPASLHLGWIKRKESPVTVKGRGETNNEIREEYQRVGHVVTGTNIVAIIMYFTNPSR